jgi:hypothetical protein
MPRTRKAAIKFLHDATWYLREDGRQEQSATLMTELAAWAVYLESLKEMQEMTVKQLIETLKRLPKDSKLYFAGYGVTDWHDMKTISRAHIEERAGEDPIVVIAE